MLPLKRFKIHSQKKRLTNLDFLPVLTLLDYSVENQRVCNVLVYIVVLFVVITIVVWMVCMVMLPNCLDSCAYLWITAGKTLYDTVLVVVESKVHQCQQNSDA